jgi:hypothetical protein
MARRDAGESPTQIASSYAVSHSIISRLKAEIPSRITVIEWDTLRSLKRAAFFF